MALKANMTHQLVVSATHTSAGKAQPVLPVPPQPRKMLRTLAIAALVRLAQPGRVVEQPPHSAADSGSQMV